jgi:hypothetical protein
MDVVTLKAEVAEVVKSLKLQGLDIAEDALLIIWHEVHGAIKRIVTASPNSYDDLYIILAPQIDKMIKDLIDRVDGKQDL